MNEKKEVSQVSKSEIRVEYVRLDELLRWERNPKDHDLPQIKTSMNRFGFTMPLMIDERTRKLGAGHGRLDSLSELKEEGKDPPLRIQIDPTDGMWMAPVLRGISFNSDTELEAYLIADNRLTEIGGWDDEALALILKDLSDQGSEALAGIGYTQDQVDDLLSLISVPDLDDLEDKYGKPEDGEMDPVIKIKVTPKTFLHYNELMARIPEEKEAKKFEILLDAVDLERLM